MQAEEYSNLGSDFETEMDPTTESDQSEAETDRTIGEVGQGETFGEQIPREDNTQTKPTNLIDEDPLLEDTMDDEDL